MNREKNDNKKVLQKHLIESLSGQKAHITFERTIEGFPLESINKKIEGVPYTAWELLEHMRIAQWDILDFIHNPAYKHMAWPEDYWPKEEGSLIKWNDSIDNFLDNRDSFIKLLQDDSTNLFNPIPHAPDYTIFREITIIANHNSYHTGQLFLLKRMLNTF